METPFQVVSKNKGGGNFGSNFRVPSKIQILTLNNKPAFGPAVMNRLDFKTSVADGRTLGLMNQTDHQFKPFVLAYSRSSEMLLLLKTFLKMWNCDFGKIDNEKDFFKYVEGIAPSIILFDISRAIDDDLETLRRLRRMEECREIPVLALSGHARREDLQMTLAAGANEYFIKPVDFDRLGSSVKVFSTSNRRNADGYYGDII